MPPKRWNPLCTQPHPKRRFRPHRWLLCSAKTSDILNGLPAETAPELAKEDDEKALARLILENRDAAPREKIIRNCQRVEAI